MDSQIVQNMLTNKTVLCYAETIYRITGVWEGPNPLNPVLPLFIIQLAVVIMLTQMLIPALRYFNQPPFVAEMLAGILLGPSVVGRLEITRLLYPSYGFYVLEPMAHFALVLFAFLMGLDTDVAALRRIGSKAMSVAVAGLIIPFIFGVSFYFMFKNPSQIGCIYWGSALTVTGFTVLTKQLERQKILHTEVGKTAMSSALLTDAASWFLLACSLTASSKDFTAQWAVICTCLFLLITLYGLRPAVDWVLRRAPEGQGYSEFYLCFILCMVWLWGIVADVSGTHPMIGAFLFGLVMQNQVLEAVVLERLEDLVFGFFMPAFFLVCGLRTNIDVMTGNGTSWFAVLIAIIMLSGAKILSSIAAFFVYKMPLDEAIPTGILTNTKGIMALVILEAGQQQGVFSTQTYTVMIIVILVKTMLVTPLMMFNQPSKNMAPYKRKTIQKAGQEDELRILSCIHGMRNVSSILTLVEASNATQRSPISIFALQLVELVGRASAMLVVHTSRKSGPRNPSHEEAQTEQIITAFDNLELRSNFITVQALTIRSAYSTMDEDICSIAWDKRAALIILPFHRQQTIDGEMEDINPAIQNVNESVLANAPCSVGILIDRGFADSHGFTRHVAMLYFGGPDDREALAYAWRMAEHPEINLKVIRFLPGKGFVQMDSIDLFDRGEAAVKLDIDVQRERSLDEEYLSKFKTATADDKTVTYEEMLINDEEQMVKAFKSLDNERHHLYIVGKGRAVVSPLTAGLADWCDCPELGPIGDLLVTSEFASPFTVLVIQQYVRVQGNHVEGSVPTSSMREDWVSASDKEFGSMNKEREHVPS